MPKSFKVYSKSGKCLGSQTLELENVGNFVVKLDALSSRVDNLEILSSGNKQNDGGLETSGNGNSHEQQV